MPALRILYVAYPLLTVSEESAGGAEQVLWTLEREISSMGFATAVAASSGSRISGELLSTGDPCSIPDDFERRNLEHQDRVVDLIHHRQREGVSFDLIHDMSGSFWPRACDIDVPLLATLHLPRHFYSPGLFADVPANVGFNCVSQSQARTFFDLPVQDVVANGVALDLFSQAELRRRNGLLWLGRICEEKAPHLALEIAARAGLPLTIAGQVYPFSYHLQYFEREIEPRLGASGALFVDSPSAQTKRRLLRQVEAVLITSQVDETSSLVAMEAAASGTPVIAYRRGALPEVIRDGVTGFLVDGVDQAVDAVEKLHEINSSDCLLRAARLFSSSAMAEGYVSLYRRLLPKTQPHFASPAGPVMNQSSDVQAAAICHLDQGRKRND